jgi:hypothetical protein
MTSKTLIVPALLALAAGAAQAAVLAPGTYELNNHPDAALRTPNYGLRLDELFDVTPDEDNFTFDFEHPLSAMFITISDSPAPSTVRIFGQTYGGRDVGTDYAMDAYTGVYTIDFTYNVGVQTVPGDDDRWVDAPNSSNFGTMTNPLGMVVQILSDERGSFNYSFRLGDADDDAGHRGFNGFSGWGWLRVDGNHYGSMDWIFTVGNIVPAPGSLALLGVGGLLAARRRR